MARCKECPPDDETARKIAEAFGLPAPVIDTPGQHYIRYADKTQRETDGNHRAMWHALVRCYDTLVDPQLVSPRPKVSAD